MVRLRRSGERRAVGPLLAIAVLVVGLLATTLVVAALHADRQDKAERVMDQRHEMALAAVRTEIGRYRALLETLAAGASTGPALTWDSFDVASAPLDDADLIGASGLAYVIPVRTEDVPATQLLWRARGAEGLTLRPQGVAEEHYFPIFVRSLSDTPPGMGGTDLLTAPELAATLAEARDTHQTTVSDTYILLGDRRKPAAQQQQSFAFATPIWTRENTPVFKGWMVLGMRGRSFLSGILDTVSQDQLFGRLVATNADGARVTVVDWSVPGEPDLSRRSDFEVGSHRWTLVTRADSARLPGAGSILPAIVGAGGLVLTVLLAWLVHVLASSRARARARVETATEELRRAEAESSRQAGLLGAVLASISDGVTVVDERGTVLLENPAGRRLMGTSAASARPEDWQRHYGVFRPDGRTPFPLEEMPLIRALHGEASDGVELVIRNERRPDGVLISIDGRPLDSSAGVHGAVAVFRDVTELRRYETDLSIFAGVVAHDLKAPLAVVRGHAELALDGLPETAGAHGDLVRIIRMVDRMDVLIETLLAYTTARHAPLRMTSVDLAPMVREAIGERLMHRGDDQPAPWCTVGELPPVEADPGMLRHVLDNLIGNALKYVRPGSTPRVDVTATAAGPDWVRVEIADAGIGIPDTEKSRVFDSFHRTEQAAGYAGTGLGLAICQRIVERHGGEIGVADNPGGGSRFFFTLPAALHTPEEIPVNATDDEAVRAALERALAERAAIQAAQLPGMGGPPAESPEPAAPLLPPAPRRDRQHN